VQKCLGCNWLAKEQHRVACRGTYLCLTTAGLLYVPTAWTAMRQRSFAINRPTM